MARELTPNERLVEHFNLSGWSMGEFARLVNRQATRMGAAHVSTDTSRVRRWLAGERPRDPVPRILAALLTEKLGRPVTVDAIGLSTPGFKAQSDDDAAVEQGPGEALTKFTEMDLMIRRNGYQQSAPTMGPAVLDRGLRTWLLDGTSPHSGGNSLSVVGIEPHPAASTGQLGSIPLTLSEIEALEHSVDRFRAWDAERGGGLQRKAVIGQLNEISPYLDHTYSAARADLGRRLSGVVADLAVLAGWISHDVGLEDPAERYFLYAAKAAQVAGDRARAGEALSRAARQRVHLGQPESALEYLRVATAATPQGIPRALAMLETVRAWAHASMGNHRATTTSIRAAETYFERDNGEPGPKWLGFFDEADLHGMEALIYRTLADTDPRVAPLAQHHAEQAMTLRPGLCRSHLFDQLSMASASLIAGDLDRGNAYATQAAQGLAHTSSTRPRHRAKALLQLMDRYRHEPVLSGARGQIGEVVSTRSRLRTA